MMNIAKFMKGYCTITELCNMPNRQIHHYYKMYVDMIKSKEKSEEHAQEEVNDEIEEELAGG